MTLCNVYNQIKTALKASWMSELHTEKLKVETLAHCDNDQAWSKVKAFQPTQGWIQTLDAVHLIDAKMPEISDHLISAELINAANESLHIRPVNKGRLMVTRFTPGQGETYYVTQTRHQIKHRSKMTGNCVYKLYWPMHQANTQPALSRFVAFNLAEKK